MKSFKSIAQDILMAAIIVTALASCGDNNTTTVSADSITTEIVTQVMRDSCPADWPNPELKTNWVAIASGGMTRYASHEFRANSVVIDERPYLGVWSKTDNHMFVVLQGQDTTGFITIFKNSITLQTVQGNWATYTNLN